MSWASSFLKERRARRDRKHRGNAVTGNGSFKGARGLPAHWRDVTLEDVPRVPGMTMPDELRYFYWCCATLHQPGRRVVELGPWVGGSTMALAAGLRRSADPRGKVTTIDCFTWCTWSLSAVQDWTLGGLTEKQRAKLAPEVLHPRAGDTFLPVFEAYTEPLKDSIEAIDHNLDEYQWSGEPVDVLMVDAAKSWKTFDQILRQFFPCLTDGAAVIHQDYKHHYCYWLHVVSERMIDRGVLSVAENVYGLSTQGFRFHKRSDFRVEDYLQSAFTNAEADRLMSRSVQRFQNPDERMMAVGAQVNLLQAQQQIERSRKIFTEALRRGGYVDNFGLADLLGLGPNWARPFVATLLKSMSTPAGATPVGVSMRDHWKHSVVLAAPGGGEKFVVETPGLDVAGGAELVLNLRGDAGGEAALRVRLEASDEAGSTPFFDEELVLPPGGFQTAVIPVAGRPKFSLRWTVLSEGPAAERREAECIVLMLLA